MPINVSWAPPANVIQQQAYIGGLGQYLDQVAQRQIQQRQLDQQAAMHQQDLAARLYEQQQAQLANQNTMLFHAAQQQQMAQQNRGWDVEDQNRQRQNQLQDIATRRQFEVADQATQQQHALDRLNESAGIEWAAKSADAADTQLTQQMAGYAQQRQYMTPEGQRVLGDLSGKLRAIQKQRPMLRPQQYGALLSQFQGELTRASLDSHINPPKTIQQRLGQETYTEPVYSPTGEFMGHQVWTSVTRNGSSTLTNKFVPYKKDDSLPAASFEQRYQNFDTFAKDFATVQKEMAAHQKAEYESKIANMSKPGSEATEPPPPPTPPTRDQVIAEMRARFDAYKAIHGGSPGGQPQQVDNLSQPGQPPITPVVNQGQQAAPQQPSPPPTMSGIGQSQGFPPGGPGTQQAQPQQPQPQQPETSVDFAQMDPEVRRRLTPEKIEQARRMGAKDPTATAAFLAGVEVARERHAKAESEKPTKLRELPKDERVSAEANMPKPTSKAEWDALPAGTMYVAPDGSVRKKA